MTSPRLFGSAYVRRSPKKNGKTSRNHEKHSFRSRDLSCWAGVGLASSGAVGLSLDVVFFGGEILNVACISVAHETWHTSLGVSSPRSQKRQWYKQNRVAAWVEKKGGWAYYAADSSRFAPGIVVEVRLAGTQVNDVAPLVSLTDLDRLILHDTEVADLAPLVNMAKLRRLDLTGTSVDNLAPLEWLATLKTLDLQGTSVTDISPLSNLKNLSWLDLSDNPISDLTPLARLTKLESLNLIGTSVTDEEVARLQKALPNCKIRR